MTGEIDDKEFQDFLAAARSQFAACVEDRKKGVNQAMDVIAEIARAVCGENVDVYAKSTADKVEFKLCYSDGQRSLSGFEVPWSAEGKLYLSYDFIKNKIISSLMNACPILAKKLSPVEKDVLNLRRTTA